MEFIDTRFPKLLEAFYQFAELCSLHYVVFDSICCLNWKIGEKVKNPIITHLSSHWPI